MEVLIAGAGIAGFALARALHRLGHRPTVVERAPALRGGYMVDFFGPGYDAAARTGLLPGLPAIHEPTRGCASSARAGARSSPWPTPP